MNGRGIQKTEELNGRGTENLYKLNQVRMERGRGSEGPASHTGTFPDLVAP